MEENATMSGFTGYDTVKFTGFNDRVLTNLESIINAFIQLPKVQAATQFYDALKQHISLCKEPHQLTMDVYKAKLIMLLYKYYRNVGYTGTVSDMLRSIVKNIEIASDEEVAEGYDYQKAVNTVSWRKLFAAHLDNVAAHQQLVDTYAPNPAINLEPAFYFSYSFGSLNNIYREENYTPTQWNRRAGTLFLGYHYDFEGEELEDESYMDLIRLTFLGFYVKLYVKYDHLESKRYLVLETNYSGEWETFSLELIDNLSGTEQILLIYQNHQLVMKSADNEITINDPFHHTVPTDLSFYSPITEDSLRELAYYPVAIDATEQKFFLN